MDVCNRQGNKFNTWKSATDKVKGLLLGGLQLKKVTDKYLDVCNRQGNNFNTSKSATDKVTGLLLGGLQQKK